MGSRTAKEIILFWIMFLNGDGVKDGGSDKKKGYGGVMGCSCFVKCAECGTSVSIDTAIADGWVVHIEKTPNENGSETITYTHLCSVCKQSSSVN